MTIIPAILTDRPKEFRELVEAVVGIGKFQRVQVDFIDGEYANNKTLDYRDIEILRYQDKLKFDAHLMVTEKNIDKYYEEAKKARFDRIIVQMESVSNPEKYLCLAMDMHSPVQAIEPYLSKLDLVMVMGIEPGFGGQNFDNRIIESLRRLNRLRRQNRYKYKIGVDGGVQKETLPILEELGVDEVVIGARRLLGW